MASNLFEQALSAEGVSDHLASVARSVFQQESGSGRNTKTSNAGAVGNMQIIPSTFKSVADNGWDINNPEHNMRAGIRYLGQMYKQANGDAALTAAGYYGGPGGLEKARRGIAVSDPRNPNAPTTLQYGQQVASRIPNSPQVQEVPVQAPVQLAQAPTPTTVAYRDVAPSSGPIPMGYVAPDREGWDQIKQAMPEQIQASSLDFGNRVQQPGYVSMEMPKVDFRAFSRFKGRA